MCGLVGLISRGENGLKVDEWTQMEHSMVFNQMRGDDSTGMLCISNKEKYGLVKAVGGYKALGRHVKFGEFKSFALNHGQIVLGHGRAATRGQVTTDNAHPFIVERPEKNNDLVLMHNGTLEWNQPLGDMWKLSNVDSEWLAMMIAHHGAEKALSEIKGAIKIRHLTSIETLNDLCTLWKQRMERCILTQKWQSFSI
jgi:glucosamine 6-phosphate synthetase-like amidotransferase/phosphosugar isomerase protein